MTRGLPHHVGCAEARARPAPRVDLPEGYDGAVEPLLYGIVAIAGAAWIVAAISAALMVPHRSPDVSMFYLMTHGHAFWSGSAFGEGARPHRRRFVIAGLVFFACIVGLAIVTALRG